MKCVCPPVPTDALANKLFGAPEPSAMARSLPTTVPDSPNYRGARTPRTPRTPHRKDSTMTPRFYPVVKEGRPVDAKVRPSPASDRVPPHSPSPTPFKPTAWMAYPCLNPPLLSSRPPGRGRPDTAPTPPWSATWAG